MKKVELTREELLNISSVLEDITIGCEDVAGGGMHTGTVYLTPNTCYQMANVLKKINESLYDKPTIYKVAYRRYRRNQNSK